VPVDSELNRELGLLTDVHEQVLREAGLAEVAEQVAALHKTAPLRRPVRPMSADDAMLTRGRPHRAPASGEPRRRAPPRPPSERTCDAAPDADAGDDLWPAVSGAQGVRERLDSLRIHPVLTAHPTEARRRAIATGLRRVSEQLQRLENPRLGPEEQDAAHRRLLEESGAAAPDVCAARNPA
jgi:phosphoenolpyruvate carboxylase